MGWGLEVAEVWDGLEVFFEVEGMGGFAGVCDFECVGVGQ